MKNTKNGAASHLVSAREMWPRDNRKEDVTNRFYSRFVTSSFYCQISLPYTEAER